MPSYNPFNSVSGRNVVTLFEIRLDNDFVVFRGSDHESSGQLLKGTVVLCLAGPLKLEDIYLRLTGTLRVAWIDARSNPSGIPQRIEKTSNVLDHKWESFVSAPASSASKNITLPEGNYEWPFELHLPGNTCESIEGMGEASLTYKLKATVSRGKLAHDIHTYKRLRVIRTLESSALEFLHAMSVENIWPNKVEYSIVVPQKAIVFGSSVPLETRFTPLLKGLDVVSIHVRLVEVQDVGVLDQSRAGCGDFKREKTVTSWVLPMSREKHWCDMIEDSGQEGWVLNTSLPLPRKLGRCMQDVHVKGIRIRHKLKMIIALKNPDGHVSELRATLPITIFISPNMPLDEEGNLIPQAPQATPSQADRHTLAPPGYGEHVLDQLYDDIEPVGMQTPAQRSGVNSPYFSSSRDGSAENLSALPHSPAIPPAVLSSRLQNMSIDSGGRSRSSSLTRSSTGLTPPYAVHHDGALPPTPQSMSASLSRQLGDDDQRGAQTPDQDSLSELNRLPSYQTAVLTPARPLHYGEAFALPDYDTAMSTPATPLPETAAADPLAMIPEVSHEQVETVRQAETVRPVISRPALGPRRLSSMGRALPQVRSGANNDEQRRLQFIQARTRMVF